MKPKRIILIRLNPNKPAKKSNRLLAMSQFNGESGADVYDRVTTFLDTMYRDFEKNNYPENTLIVSHGLTIRLFLMRWFHWSVEEYESKHNPKNREIIVMKKQMDDHYIQLGER
jgi:broad specificity phosphatase PhoE